jgi:hypothetical protein
MHAPSSDSRTKPASQLQVVPSEVSFAPQVLQPMPSSSMTNPGLHWQ